MITRHGARQGRRAVHPGAGAVRVRVRRAGRPVRAHRARDRGRLRRRRHRAPHHREAPGRRVRLRVPQPGTPVGPGRAPAGPRDREPAVGLLGAAVRGPSDHPPLLRRRRACSAPAAGAPSRGGGRWSASGSTARTSTGATARSSARGKRGGSPSTSTSTAPSLTCRDSFRARSSPRSCWRRARPTPRSSRSRGRSRPRAVTG